MREGATKDEQIACMLQYRYGKAEAERAIALRMFEKLDTLAGVEPKDSFDGGFRGRIQIVPELPVGPHKKHLQWVDSALEDIDDVFHGLATRRGTPDAPRYRWRGLSMTFFRSVGRTTPSAYASGWRVAYNVSGSLHTSADAVRETLFHEIFHLNDAAHGDWSVRTLTTEHAALMKKCHGDVACLAPYAPGDTKVKGGTYYAFQPDNGLPVREYGAELALRWYREQRAVLRGEKLGRTAFKCGPAFNKKAWEAIVAEFFGGTDLVPACG